MIVSGYLFQQEVKGYRSAIIKSLDDNFKKSEVMDKLDDVIFFVNDKYLREGQNCSTKDMIDEGIAWVLGKCLSTNL